MGGKKLIRGKERWNNAAKRFQNTMHNENESKYPDELMKYLIRKGAVAPNYTVADIGCGVGKYAIRFSAEGCNLLLIDISDCMLDYTKMNLECSNTDYRIVECDFSQTDIEEMGWEKSAELVFASMTPAINSERDIDKMCQMSKQHCFLSRFAKSENKIMESICTELNISLPNWIQNSYYYTDMAVYIKKLGYIPEITFADYEWENEITINEMVDKLFDYNSLDLEDTVENRKRTLAAVSRISDGNGMIHEEVKSKIAWLYWDVTK